MKRRLTVILLMLFTQANVAGTLEFYHQRYLEKQTSYLLPSSIKTAHFEQWIDHEHPAAGIFLQRYYLDETYGPSKDSPVFFYICGEAACSPKALNGAIRDYAQTFHAKLIALEHRFYGKSQPYTTLSANHLRSLTTTAALQDLANFQQAISARNHWTGKWIAFGGSYPGSLSAYYRMRYPELVVGALASSAPVMAKEDFYEYDAHVASVAGPECAAKIRLAVNDIEEALADADKTRFTNIKTLFNAENVHNDIDFLYLVADTAAAAVQYGMHDEFCSSLINDDTALEGYAHFARTLFARWGITALELTAEGAMSENPEDYSEGLGLRQWFYQSCKEYGYWQNANPDRLHSTRSVLINNDYHRNICWRLFGIDRPVNTDYTNEFFYLPLIDLSTSNIHFTNGSNDPWSNLSMTEKNGNATNPHLTYATIENAAHCDDLHSPKPSDSVSLQSARQAFEYLLNQWLN
ncbi:S28 family serine protease [Legionella nagasakiensis]|uniref:S28 family serine protease n=1 Tax=Legionella nagasakiensis TaxID=535290 RepID=UPI001055ECF0|nr:S28 family serine protease [Legionella nagasakiensis]